MLHSQKKADITFTPRPPPVYHQGYLTIVYVSGIGKTGGWDYARHRPLPGMAQKTRRTAAADLLWKKWDGKGIDIKVICRGPARGMMRVQNDPSTTAEKKPGDEE
jgi:hypothetical protein